MKKYILFCFLALLFVATHAGAQDGYNERVKKYVAQYYSLALSEQKSAGIPACITLAQGVLETEAGASELMTEANNHFGIKCKNNWQGETFLHDDDEKSECFKKYKNAAESFKDHSNHLRNNPRYAPLFRISETDYASWAIGLKKCGYATNPQYALKLIKIIEDFKLQEYTYVALDSSMLNNYASIPMPSQTPVAERKAPDAIPVTAAAPPQAITPFPLKDTIKMIVKVDTLKPAHRNATAKVTDSAKMNSRVKETIARADTIKADDTLDIIVADNHYDSNKIVSLNGLKAFYAYKNDILLQYAVKYHIRYARLLEINDLPDAPLPYDMYIYLEKKLSAGIQPTHTVQDGETMFMISQTEGVQLRKLLALNLLNPNEQPFTGTVLQLQKPAEEKPDVCITEVRAHKSNAIIMAATEDPQKGNDYIDINRPEADTAQMHAVAETRITEKAGPKEQPVNIPVTAPVKEAPGPAGVSEVQEAKERAEKDEELAALKADLDKEVYSDNTRRTNTVAGEAPSQKYEAPSPVASAAGKGDKFYTIKRGDTAFSIAKRNNITLSQLMEWNNIEPADIKTGKRIQVRE